MAKIGIMSFAHMHAEAYAASVNRRSDAQLVAVWDDDPKRGADAAKRHETRFIGDLDAFLDSGLEGVVITSENVKHRELTERAAAAGLWVLSEKPLATTIEDGKAMIEACRSAGVGLGTAFPCRYIPSIQAVRAELEAGKYGDIYAVTCTNNGQFPGGWFGVEALSGGGATMDHTVHVADLLRWMLGKEFVSVYCENGHLMGRDTALDDVGVLHLEMDGGTIVSHVASWNRAKSFPTWGDVTMEFVGEKGVVEVDAFNQKLNVYDDRTMRAQWAYWGGDPDLGLVSDFIESVNERREPAITGEDGFRALEVTVAAYKSVASRQRVAI